MKKIVSTLILLGAIYFFTRTDTNGFSMINSSANSIFYLLVLFVLVVSLGVVLATDFDKMNRKILIIKIFIVVFFGLCIWYVNYISPMKPFYELSRDFNLVFYLVVSYLSSYILDNYFLIKK